jgi:hypothetical protein
MTEFALNNGRFFYRNTARTFEMGTYTPSYILLLRAIMHVRVVGSLCIRCIQVPPSNKEKKSILVDI